MKNIMFSLFVMMSVSVSAQNVVEWKGGTPGLENQWNEARNWSSNQVPDANTYVLIKGKNSGHNAMPVIDEKVVVASIELQQDATLTVTSDGLILVDGTDLFSYGIVCRNSRIVNDGSIVLKNIEQLKANQFLQYTRGDGLVYMEDSLLDSPSYMKYTYQDSE